ncbi:izumo sperm-egg fusion protein 2 isoform X3 [Mus caroli]|uniref:Izumo sperm-egg fusion protein 2 isoform X3 n=1 Tax=Mus caroli TaxID=10089 RepID=A0A6P5PXV5_MUSCR|nr:izumo sperm-egg fusion protein 2 isoform X3 [Mus caroli]
MPLALALVLLCGLGGPGAWGCLQCDQSVLLELRQLREAIVTKRFHLEGLQARAQALLLSMEGPFFRDYAVNAFVGKVVVDQLEKVATSFKNQAQYIKANSKTDVPLLEELVSFREHAIKELKRALRDYEMKACDHKACLLGVCFSPRLPLTLPRLVQSGGPGLFILQENHAQVHQEKILL